MRATFLFEILKWIPENIVFPAGFDIKRSANTVMRSNDVHVILKVWKLNSIEE